MHILESLLWQRKKIAEHLLLGRQTYKVIGYIRLRVGDRDFDPVGYVPFPLDRQIGCKRWESGCVNQFIKCRYLFPGRESGYPAFFLHSFSKTDIRAKKHGFPLLNIENIILFRTSIHKISMHFGYSMLRNRHCTYSVRELQLGYKKEKAVIVCWTQQHPTRMKRL